MPLRRRHLAPRPVRRPDPHAPVDLIELLEHRRLLAAETPALLSAANLTFDKNPKLVLNKRLPGVAAAMSGRPAPSRITVTAPVATSAPVITEPVAAEAAEALVATPSGALTGKFVFTSGGHGWQWSTTLGRYATDRGDNNEIVEDFGNQEQLTWYADYLLRAGATVIPMRPIGRQINEVVLDNDSAGVTFTGAWSNSSSSRYYDEDYGASLDTIPYRFATTTTGAESAVATYTPNIPAAGFYPVYTWVLRGTDRTSQLYRVNHSGGTAEIRVDHSKVGSGWVYLGTYHFNAGSSATAGSVQISNNAAVGGKVIIADTIRFGNGMGDYTDSGASGPSGYPREDENSFKWIVRSLGVGTTISTSINTTSNVSAPSNMAQYMFAGSFGEAVYVGIHSNAGGGRGAVGLIDADAVDRTPNQSNLALFLGRQINQDMQALNGVFEHNWDPRTTHTFTGEFGEIDLGGSAEMDATIIEIAFHDSVQDAQLMRDPKVRDQIARSLLQGTIEYFQNHGGLTNTTSLPTPPTNVRAASNASGAVTVNWAAGPSTPASVYGAAATGYRIYTSTNGYGFELAATVAGGATASTTLTGLDPNTPLYIRVAATNAGGESSPSEVMTALPTGGAGQVLIVNGFDRFDRTQNFRYAYAHTGDLLVDRVWSRYNNSFDYVVNVHSAIHAAKPGTRVASTSNEAVISGAVNLNDYDAVIWILGNESTANDTFNATEQAKVEQFVAAGGHVFVSGSEVGLDLDQQNNGRSFYENTLKGNFVSDDAGSYTANAAAGGIFAGLASVGFSSGAPSTGAGAYTSLVAQMYNVTAPDVIAPQAGGVTALTYANGAGTAAIQVAGTGGRGNVVLFGFPFETMTNSTRREQVMGRVLDFFFTATSPAPGTPDLLAASDTGSSFADNVTRLRRSLQFIVPDTVPGALVQLYVGTTLVAEATATGTSTTLTATDPYTFADGTHQVTAVQTVPDLPRSAASASLTITVDTMAPAAAIFPVASQRTTPLDAVGINFSEPVVGLESADLTIYRDNDLLVPGAGQPISVNGNTHTVSNLGPLTYRAGSYYLLLDAATAGVTDLAGNAISSSPSVAWNMTAITGSAANDTITLGSHPTLPDTLVVTVNADAPYTVHLPWSPSLSLLTFGGDDTLTFDLTAGPLALDLTLPNLSLTVHTVGTPTASGIALHLAPRAEVRFASRTRLADLTIDDTATADLLDNDLVLDNANALTLRDYLRTGKLFSSTAVANPAQNTTLGHAVAADLGLSTFAGLSVNPASLLVKYTYHNDTDLDGRVTYDDLARTDRGVLFGRTTWLDGDSDHDGDVDAADVARARHAFATQTVIL